MDKTVLKSFPSNDREALAMLYVKSQDLSNVTIEELVAMYDNAYKAISAIRSEQYNARLDSEELF